MAWDRESLITGALQAGLAGLGGLIGGLLRKELTTVREAIIGAMGAGFVGVLVGKFCHGSGLSDDNTFICVALAGLIGAERSIAMLQRALGKTPFGGKWPEAGGDVPKPSNDEHKQP